MSVGSDPASGLSLFHASDDATVEMGSEGVSGEWMVRMESSEVGHKMQSRSCLPFKFPMGDVILLWFWTVLLGDVVVSDDDGEDPYAFGAING